jgi:hypothetical protein
MSSSFNSLKNDIELIAEQCSFIELQLHDNIMKKIKIDKTIHIPLEYTGYFSFHGEGETDGKKRIKFCSSDNHERSTYISQCVNLYNRVSECLANYKVSRLILHPDTLNRRLNRHAQIELLAYSLSEMTDKINGIGSICIEPRGGICQGKVLRLEIEDVCSLENSVNSLGLRNLGLCIDIAQLHVAHGINGSLQFLKALKSMKLPVKELHVSDVLQSAKVKNRVAMEVGVGSVDWKLILPSVLQHCNELLIETLGGVKVFQRSKMFLDSLLKEIK